MIAITRTHRQWLATTRNLARASGHRELIIRIQDAIAERPADHPDEYLAINLTPAHVADHAAAPGREARARRTDRAGGFLHLASCYLE